MIVLTDRAVHQVRSLMAQNGFDTHGLRVSIAPGGCSGFSYVLDLVDEQEAEDLVFEQDGVRILCDPKSHQLIDGLAIDYDSSMFGGGFKFDNPQAKKACGCGTSFAC